jgi:phage FluMu gp28-like protein
LPRASRLERIERLEAALRVKRGEAWLPKDPVEFARRVLRFDPLPYQEKLLRDGSKRIAVRMSRQAGKTTTIAARAIWFAATHPRTLTLIVAPSLRQSMIMSDKIEEFLFSIPEDLRRKIVAKIQRTVIRFRNGSKIVALPNSPQRLRGYTAHQVICDEAAFFRDDELVFYNVLYPMLSTTDGTLIVSSTPWGKDSVFYRMFQSDQFSKHVVTWREPVKCGLIKRDFIEEMRRIYPLERFQREYEAAFVEDAKAYFSQDLITRCLDSELWLLDFEERAQGEFYMGIDFGKKVDHSAIAVVERDGSQLLLRHVKQFRLEEPYASVIGYAKTICDRYRSVMGVYADRTGVGEYIVEDMERSGIPNLEGVVLTSQAKEEILGYMKQVMVQNQFRMPYDPDLVAEINCEQFELTKDGHIRFSHPEGTHDDRLWAIALAIYASRRLAGPRPIPVTRSF